MRRSTDPPSTWPASGRPADGQPRRARRLATVPGTAIGISASTYDASLLDVQAMVTVDYGAGNTIGQRDGSGETGPQIAADWVRYANIQHHYGIKYWEIGSEVHGNGTYGANWEADDHCTTTPTGGPVVLTALGRRSGFADVHWYPQNPSNLTPPGPTDAGLLAGTAQIPAPVSALRTESDSGSSSPGRRTQSVVNALYLEQDYLTWLENGVSNADWWQIHNGIVTSGDNGAGLAGTADYDDYGVLSDGSCGTVSGGAVRVMVVNTTFTPARA